MAQWAIVNGRNGRAGPFSIMGKGIPQGSRSEPGGN
jgi:hypothetical protein